LLSHPSSSTMRIFLLAAAALLGLTATVSAQDPSNVSPSAYANPACSAQGMYTCDNNQDCYAPCTYISGGRAGKYYQACSKETLISQFERYNTPTPDCTCIGQNLDFCSIDGDCYDNTMQYCDRTTGVTDLPTEAPTDAATDAPTDAPTDAATTEPATTIAPVS
jgi:hypothetical protein